MWELDCEESWVLKNWCFWTVVLEKTLEGPLDSKEIQPVHPKGDQSWVFIGRTDAEAESPVLWPPDVKSGLIGKTLMLGGIGGRRRRGRQRMRWLMASPAWWAWVWVDSGSGWWTGRRAAIHGAAKSRTRLSDWAELKAPVLCELCNRITEETRAPEGGWACQGASPVIALVGSFFLFLVGSW